MYIAFEPLVPRLLQLCLQCVWVVHVPQSMRCSQEAGFVMAVLSGCRIVTGVTFFP